jgi:hypothetical protein
MSLDFYLEYPINRLRNCPECGSTLPELDEREVVYDSNITHNLGRMAAEAGIYKHLWRPEEIGITKAEELIEPLTKAIAEMKADPARFEKFNASNGWGLYVHFVPFVEEILAACKKHPKACPRASR